ncbi:MAG: lipoyl synthase [Candidatus Omnitrophica bacterium]|nr:lipoyl synthase [Candidatus Omnitrophota bacterium]
MEQLERPEWIRAKVSWDNNTNDIFSLVKDKGLHSVCEEAACPNRGECWHRRHVTFMILGDTCTRGCRFCNVKYGAKGSHNREEPRLIGEAVKELGAEYVVLTSVTRDDLPDGGASHFTNTVNAVKRSSPGVLVELLVPDLGSRQVPIKQIISSDAVVIGHNIEMPEDLYPQVRPRSDYRRSLKTLRLLASEKGPEANIMVKSSLILGLGESRDQIRKTLKDLFAAGAEIVYLGQYLSPSREHYPVKKYYSPEEFDDMRAEAMEMGFKSVMSSPLVRSSYRAGEAYSNAVARTA